MKCNTPEEKILVHGMLFLVQLKIFVCGGACVQTPHMTKPKQHSAKKEKKKERNRLKNLKFRSIDFST